MKVYIIIAIIIPLILAYAYLSQSTVETLSQPQIDRLYGAMNTFDKVAMDNNIDYFIICGTLLGSLRQQSLIPWDNDIDLGIKREDLDSLLEKKASFEKYGMKFDYRDGIQRIDFGDVFIDLFPFVKEGDTYVHETRKNRKRFPKEAFKEEMLFPTKRSYLFGPLLLNGPQNGMDCVVQLFGDNWQTPINYAKLKKNPFFFWKYNNKTMKPKKALPTRNYMNIK